jgi:Uma2 family endonuclease
MSSTLSRSELLAVDERLVVPGARYEVLDAEVVYVPPADEPHGSLHADLAALVLAHRREGYSVAVDMLTRTSKIDDIAPDVSVYPTARDPRTGGRQLEEIAFEIASTESLSHAQKKATKLSGRGVRRIFVIDVEQARVHDCSVADRTAWIELGPGAELVDPAFATPLPIAAIIDAARRDAAIVRAFRVKRHPEFAEERAEGHAEGRAEGRAEGLAEGHAEGLAEGHAEGHAEGRAEGYVKGRAESVVCLLAARGIAISEAQRVAILAERSLDRLSRWLAAAVTCTSATELLALP